MITKEIEFSKLRHAYTTIKKFLEDSSGVEVNSVNQRIAEDLGLFGDDNYFLLEQFVEKFELEHEGLEYERYFYSEAELFDSKAALFNLFTLSVWLPMKTIELLTLNKFKLNKPSFYKPEHPVNDMTFKDMLTWYLEGTYATSEHVQYRIKST
ncbi:DUF1493 family protein [Fulvivirga sediminis]|uniref:DUF1493 family protein n=1 Tax=Fulvivirga sediminis TaxID=2803949 RepID=A0A937K2R5_9BACT|nr:DUF1493 family protein [Fulvivirga sediminis]MBL3658645.1 DUF1493 family protein [Fulvivirga sediminis]